jgi:general secretion pathway protein B
MSYILDALKKSERQRPPGQAPDLFTVQGPVQSGNSRRPLVAVAVVASVVGAAALGGWAWFGGRDRQAQVPPEAGAPANPVTATRAATPEPATPSAAGIPAATPPASPAAARRTPGARPTGAVTVGPKGPLAAVPAAPQPGLVPAPVGSAVVQTAAPRSPESPAAAFPAAMPPPAAISPVTQATDAPVPDVVAVPAIPPEVLKTPPGPVAIGAEPGASPRQGAVDAPPPDGRVVSIEELPESVRAVLASFAVSGHVWSEEPALRLVTVQDRIVREGGEAAPGVRLEEITQDGAVFTVGGWRFRTGF